LNILAELLRFGDREFYKDWWNARTIEEVKVLLKVYVLYFGVRLNRANIVQILMHSNVVVFGGLTSVLEDVEYGNFLTHP
jgi:intracellular septation protein A